MPPLCNFDPRPATLQWMDEKEHRTRNTLKAAKQEWFHKVFQQGKSFKDQETEGDDKEKLHVKRQF